MALRVPYPLTISHAAAGSCPGVGIIRRTSTTSSWELTAVLPSTVLDATAARNLSDPHAVAQDDGAGLRRPARFS